MRRAAIAGFVCCATLAIVAACVGENPDVEPPVEAGSDAGSEANDAGGTGSDSSSPPVDSGARAVRCNGSICRGTQICCNAHEDGGCAEPNDCASAVGRFTCDDRADCPPGQYCCMTGQTEEPGDADSRVFMSSSCATDTAACPRVVCTTPADCPAGNTLCDPSAPGYYPYTTLCR